MRIAFPIITLDYQQGTQIRKRGLQLIEVNNIQGQAMLSNAGMLVAEEGDRVRFSNGYSRGLIHSDAIYFAHARAIWSAFWDTPEQNFGPILDKPELCDLDPLLSVNVILPEDAETAACDYAMNAIWQNTVNALTPQPSSVGHICSFVEAIPNASSVLIEGILFGYTDIQYWTNIPTTNRYCNVGRSTEISFAPLAVPTTECHAESQPSLHIALQTKDQSTRVCEAQVSVYQNQTEYTLSAIPSDSVTLCHYEGPYDVSGSFSVGVKLEGYANYLQNGIQVERDICGVETQNLSIELLPLIED